MSRKRAHRAVPARKPKAPSIPPPALPVVTSAMGAVALLKELIAEDIASIRSGKDRNGKRLSPTAHRLLQRSAMAQVKELAKLTGEADAMPDAKILKLPGFRRIIDDVVRALVRFPEAADAVAAELERIERGGLTPAEETRT